MVKVIVATPDENETRRWQEVFRPALPECEVQAWKPGAGSTGASYAVVWSPPDELFRVETGLRAVFNLGAGVDRVLASPNLPDIPVLRLEDAGMARQMAEYVVHHLASFSRGFQVYAAQQQKRRWAPLRATRYEDWPVGVMGLGALGAHVAQVVAGLGYPVAGWARTPKDIAGVEVFQGREGLGRFLARTRVLVNLLPLTPDTAGIVDRRLLAQLLPDSVVINIARGAHIVDSDLLEALESRRVQAAVLDVFAEEPLPEDHPYWVHPRVRVTPHVAAATLEADAVAQISERLRRMERGEPVGGIVLRDRGY